MKDMYDGDDEEKMSIEQTTYNLFCKIARYHNNTIASTVASLYVHSLTAPNNESTWPREGLFWIHYLQRQEKGNRNMPINIDLEPLFDTKWKGKYIKSILQSLYEWDEQVSNKFVDDILDHPGISINMQGLMSWDMIMKWISLQEVDEIEALLFQLFKVSQERKELDKLSKSIIGDVPSLDALERYFLFYEAREIWEQLNKGIVPVDKYSRVKESIDHLDKFYKEGWEHERRILPRVTKDDKKEE